MQNQFSRTQLLFGEEAMDKLAASRVAVFGIGGVGGHVVEALARSGIGAIDLIDDDKVSLSNINRQIVATLSTVGRYKTDVAEERIHDINPECRVTAHRTFFMPETADEFDFTQYDYVVDAIDTVTGKIEIIMRSKAAGAPVISCMGAGNKIDPTAFKITDIYKTSMCPLAKVMRHEMKKRRVKKLKVLYSTEQAIKPAGEAEEDNSGNIDTRPGAKKKTVPGSNAFVPSVAGLIIAGEVIKDLIKLK